MKETTNKKNVLLFSILIAIFTIGIVPKQFQNDTFFNISIGKYILENGIDMQEHFSWISGLSYTYSHWIFDIIIYLLYKIGNFTGIYIFTILFSILINITLFNLLNKKSNNSIISFIITLITAYFTSSCYTARSQIISFLCFIIEIYCLEKFVDTNKKRYAFILAILSVIIANFHAATWPLFLILFMPYIIAAILNLCSRKTLYIIRKNWFENKLKKLPNDSIKFAKYKNYCETYNTTILELEKKEKSNYFEFSKLYKKKDYKIKSLLILFIIICFTGLLTPIKDVPYTYILKSMFGKSNFENTASMSYVSEMQPLTPIYRTDFCVFTIIFFAFFTFMPTKLRLDRAFLIAGLYLMSFISVRYTYLLVFLGSYILCDLITQCTNKFIPEDIKSLEKLATKSTSIVILLILFIITTANNILDKNNIDYVNEELYPIAAVDYIKENLDYKNIRIYNHYNYGSYLMLNDIPVFIDSRLDVYCSEFNDTNVFYDFIQVSEGYTNYEEIFKKYNFTHILLNKTNVVYKYLSTDSNYKLLHDDNNFALYERK